MLAGSIFSTTLVLAGSSLSNVRVDENFVKAPRTVVTIMCFTENAAVLWFGSASRVIGAAVRKAARKSVMSGDLLESSCDLPQLHHRSGVPARGLIGLEGPLGQRPALIEDVIDRIEVLGFVETG